MSDESDKSPPTKKRRVMASERTSTADTSGGPSTSDTYIMDKTSGDPSTSGIWIMGKGFLDHVQSKSADFTFLYSESSQHGEFSVT